MSVTLHPADADTGIVFSRGDFEATETSDIPAHYSKVCATDLCTVIGDLAGSSVSTVEHLLAAFAALGIDNAVVETDGGEVPILDGSSAPFVEAVTAAGVRQQGAPRRYLKVLKPVRVEMGDSFGELRPHDGFSIDVEIDFDTPVIGRQRYLADVCSDGFASELARARTFGFMKDVEALWSAGFALGASLDNTVVIGEDRVVNPEGTRFGDEFVRHKALDAIGDLSLAGAPILGAFRSYRGGHKLNFAVLNALFDDADAWQMVEMAPRRETGHAAVTERLAAAAFSPDVS